jgi:ankyrin repeat protein
MMTTTQLRNDHVGDHVKEESPVQFLRAFFSKDEGQFNARPCIVDPAVLDAYDMESVQAVRTRDVTKLRELVAKGKSLDASNRNGETLLHLACRRGDLATVQFLLEEAHVNTDVCDDMGRTILHDVCWRTSPDLEIMAILIRTLLPSTLIAQDRRGHTPFDYARREHRSVWMSFLKENKELIERRVELVAKFAPTSSTQEDTKEQDEEQAAIEIKREPKASVQKLDCAIEVVG